MEKWKDHTIQIPFSEVEANYTALLSEGLSNDACKYLTEHDANYASEIANAAINKMISGL